MFDQHERGEEEIVERVVRELKRPVYIDRAVDARVMSEIAQTPVAEPVARPVLARAWPWFAAAAVLGAILIARPGSGGSTQPDAFQFVLVAPQAASVALVGDFN